MGTQDYIIIGVKAHAIANIVEGLKPLLNKYTAILSAVNGIPWWYFYKANTGTPLDNLPIEAVDPNGKIWHEIGLRLAEEDKGKDSFLAVCAKKNIKVFVPGPTDGAVGSQLWLFWQTHKDFTLDILEEEHELSDIVHDAKSTGAIMIGGGISKHHTIWWNQFREGLDFAVQVTTAPEWDGSLSGARVREAVSWGKVTPKARRITVEGDATVLLPLILGPLL